MRITHIISELIPGGGERVAVELANSAARSGHQVSMVVSCPTPNSGVLGLLDSRIVLHYVATRRQRFVLRYLRIIGFILRNPWLFFEDVAHVHLTFGAVFGVILRFWPRGKSASRPLVVETYHSVGMPMAKWRRWVRARIASQFDGMAFMAEDQYWSDFMSRHPGLVSAVIPNGISVSMDRVASEQEVESYRSSLGIPHGCEFVVGTIGMLRPDRKPEATIQVFAHIARAMGAKTHFVMFGAGTELAKMQELVDQLGMRGVIHLPGLVTDSSLPLAIMDVFVSLNVGELTGMAALEAAFRSVIIVGIQMRPDYSARDSDWIWSSLDLSAVAARVVDLLLNSSERGRLRDAQFAYAIDHFSVAAMAESYFSLYETARCRLIASR